MNEPPPRPRLLRLRIVVWRLRGVLVCLGALAVVMLVARTLAPPPPATEPVVVLARHVAAGTVLTAADLRLRPFPTCCAPEEHHADVADLLGRALAVPGPAGLPVVDGLLAGARFEVDPPAGSAVVPVRLAAAGLPLLRPGDRIDLVATADPWRTPAAASDGGTVPEVAGTNGAEDTSDADGTTGTDDPAGTGTTATLVLARAALVVQVPEAVAEGALGLAGPAPDAAVVVAVTPAEGRVLAAASAGSPLGAVLVG
ncbi:hypothetical protein ICW40_16475 [Actinotalea ferrariae]|uniref:SAF domain-containing protein n=1 Tax=Actinotalea ferrariae TaxID=1386098 RepID=UPI001C8C7B68|nr:SAF domain-containing protein [Actinotalea ferrariae]MBX9246391.1 hypothetical protein [Actinotalea ferrariae]